jgi:hypothetical protein
MNFEQLMAVLGPFAFAFFILAIAAHLLVRRV